jgi:hypothetical protein
MNDTSKLKTFLEDGETIEWSGTPQPYTLFDASRKSSTVASLCWAVAWAVLLLGGYFALSIVKDLEIKSGVMVCLAAVPLFIAWVPVSDKGKVKKLLYAVTNKRVISLSQGESEPVAIARTAIDAVRVEQGDNGNCHVRIGSSVDKAPAKKLPGLAYRGEYDNHDGTKTYTGVVFFNVRSADGIAIQNALKSKA